MTTTLANTKERAAAGISRLANAADNVTAAGGLWVRSRLHDAGSTASQMKGQALSTFDRVSAEATNRTEVAKRTWRGMFGWTKKMFDNGRQSLSDTHQKAASGLDKWHGDVSKTLGQASVAVRGLQENLGVIAKSGKDLGTTTRDAVVPRRDAPLPDNNAAQPPGPSPPQ